MSSGVIVTSQWQPDQGCVIMTTNNKAISAMFLYSMLFDLIVLALTAWRLYDWNHRSHIEKLLFHDGLIYFAIA